MEVSVSGYYAWRKRLPSAQEQQNTILLEQIKTVHEQSDQTYGSPRIYAELKDAGIACSQKRVARLMRLSQLYAVTAKRFVVTTDSKHALPIAENLLDRAFSVQTPHARGSADITYLWTGEGWLYLGVVLDLFSRRIVGWALGET